MHEGSASGAVGTGWRTACVFLAFAAIALFLLLSEHRAHAVGLLPFLLLAACPLLHIFMHGGPGHGGRGAAERDPARPSASIPRAAAKETGRR